MTGTLQDHAPPVAPAVRTVPLDPGDAVGDPPDCCWRVVRHVADGGFSSVYEVRPATPETVDRHGGAPRALKCVWGTPAELTAINTEAARTAEVDGHPGVLRLVTSFRFSRSAAPHQNGGPVLPHRDAGRVLPHHYVGLVLELADEDLPAFGARVAPDERAWAAVFEQVAAGLEHIHARRIVHGDIKPTNVLRLGARFAVADFGVSAPLESTRSAGIGLARTIAFWPPESASQGVLQADGVRRPPVDGWRASQAGDVWALAVSAHRMLTGRHITAGTTPEQQYELVCLGRYAVDGRLGAGWRRLLEDCLVHEPQRRRLTTAAQLRRRLAELAVPASYAGAPWPPGAPRLAALLDLDPAAGGPLLALTLDRPGGRVSGTLLPAAGMLPAAVRHLTDDVLPALAAGAGPGPAAAPAAGAGPGAAAPRPVAVPGPADPAATQLVTTAELQRTRQLTVSVSRQRDRLAADRDQLVRSRDDLAADRDRLRGDYEALARRLDRLEREAATQRSTDDREPTRVLGRQGSQPTRAFPAASLPPAGPAVPALNESRVDVRLRPSGLDGAARERAGRRWRRTASVPAVPAVAPPAPPRPRPGRLLRRFLRRLVALVAVVLAFAVFALVGTAALLDTSPDRVGARVAEFVDRVRTGGGP